MAATQTIRIPTADNHPVVADVYAPSKRAAGVVILCHGFKGYRRWGFLPYLAERLRDRGLWALSIDFSHNGTVRTTDSFDPIYVAPDRFEANTLKREFEDLSDVIAHVRAGRVPGIEQPTRLGLMGHSRGAVASILHAVEDEDVRALVTWASTDDPDFYTPKQKTIWRECGRLAFTEASDRTPLALGIDYLDDLEQNHDFYCLRERVRALQAPYLLVHGELDMVIPPSGSRAVYDAAALSHPKKLVELKTGHAFGIAYPPPAQLEKIPRALAIAADETADWFVAHLTEGSAR